MKNSSTIEVVKYKGHEIHTDRTDKSNKGQTSIIYRSGELVGATYCDKQVALDDPKEDSVFKARKKIDGYPSK